MATGAEIVTAPPVQRRPADRLAAAFLLALLALGCLALPVLAQRGHRGGVEPDGSPALGGLGRTHHRLVVHRDDGLSDRGPPVVEVNVSPTQAERLAASHPDGRQPREQWWQRPGLSG